MKQTENLLSRRLRMQQQFKKLKDRLYGPTGSVVLHIFLIALMIFLVKSPETEATKPEEIIITMEPNPMMPVPPPMPPKPPQPPVDDPSNTFDGIPTPKAPDTSVNIDEIAPPEPQQLSRDALDPANQLASIFSTPKGTEMMGLMPEITIGEGPTTATEETEAAVLKGLNWLKENQREDGSWDKNRIAMTGLALLTFLAHGETPGKPKYGNTVERGIDYLLDHQSDSGFFGKSPNEGNAAVYAHAIATYAISEAYAMTYRAVKLRAPLEKATYLIVRGQQTGGGWYYNYKKSDRRDTSVAGWQIQALKSAKLNRIEVPGLDAALKRAEQDIRAIYNPDNYRFGYTSAGSGSLGMSGVGVLSLQLLGKGKSPEARGGLRALNAARIHWTRSGMKSPLYSWYYITQAKFHAGGTSWNRWNRDMIDVLTAAQAGDGHWDFPTSHDGKAEHGHTEGPVYSTTLATMILEVYYRFLPTFQREAAKEVEEIVTADDDPIIIEIE
ncbi:MAG: prenyltransferase/squalene oxidase repeat-containing protein [Verrucomicrobiota bacterium]